MHKASADNHPCTDARAGGHVQHVLKPAPGTVAMLAERCQVGVFGYENGDAEVSAEAGKFGSLRISPRE